MESSMSAATVLALVTSGILFSLCVSSLSLWRALRQAYWWQFALVSGVGSLIYLFDVYPRPLGDRPNLVATVMGLFCIGTVMKAIAGQQRIGAGFMRWLRWSNAVVIVLCVSLVYADQVTRLQLAGLYTLIYFNQSAVIGLARGFTVSTTPLMLSLCLYPTAVLGVYVGWVDAFWLRYLVGLVMFLVCMCILVDGLLRENARMVNTVGKLDYATHQLQSTLEAMLAGSSKVAVAGQEVSSSAQELAIRTDQQTDHVRSVAEVINAVADQVQQTTSNVVAVDEQCNRLKDHARQGDEVVNGAVSSIQLISQRSTEMNAAISMIESIAFQTNILAINAAIEAARAGTAGRGFAVVAAEVRALSQRTTDSARQVKQLIERTTAQADDGVHRIQGVKESLAGIVQNVEDVAARTQQVASDAMAQSQSLAAVKQRLEDLAELTDSNAQLVATSVMAADEMNASAADLREMVARSHLTEEAVAAGLPAEAQPRISAATPTWGARSAPPSASKEVEFF